MIAHLYAKFAVPATETVFNVGGQMKLEPFEMERMQSTWENIVEYDMSESGVQPVTLRELVEMGFDLEGAMDTPLGYSQSNGTPELRSLLCQHYPGASLEHVEVTNGTSEANYLIAQSLLKPGDEFALQVPNYMQMWGVPRGAGAAVNRFEMHLDDHWGIDWDEFDSAVNTNTRLVYVSNPNNPTGSVLSEEAMKRIVARCDEVGAYLLADEVYQGAEIARGLTPSFWGMSDRVIVASGLSKAYGIPGVRIGWIIGPPQIVSECWTQHDYLTIGPNKLSDAIARVAVANREKLYDRTRLLLKENLQVFLEFVDGFGGFLSFREPVAGAICLIHYKHDIPSLELAERIRTRQNTLVVPGIHVGLEGHLRIWIGGKLDFLKEGLRRIGAELRKLM
jgi:aspartate/methionine/tyrosine aminotransferase